MEHKSQPMQTESINDRTVTTLFSTAGVVDRVSDRMHPGSFSKTIQERGSKVLHLWAHDGLPPIAVVDSLREVSRAELPKSIQDAYPDAIGGCLAVSTYLDTPRGNEILAAIKAGAPLEASFGYDVVKVDPFTNEDGRKIRNIKEVKLYEISTCQFGANSATRGDASKALLSITDPDELLATLRAMLTKAGARNATHDQKIIDDIHQLAYDLGARNCLGIPESSDDKSRADAPAGVPLTLLKSKLAYLDFITP